MAFTEKEAAIATAKQIAHDAASGLDNKTRENELDPKLALQALKEVLNNLNRWLNTFAPPGENSSR